MKRLLFSSKFVFFLFFGLIFYNTSPVFAVSSFKLSNGLEVYFEENHRFPVVTQIIFYKVGSWEEPLGKSGIAHLLEHMMFKGSKNYPAGYFSKEVSRRGGEENAFTSSDVTAYHQSISKEHLPLIMQLEADRMQNLEFSSQSFDFEKQVVLEERLFRYENSPLNRLREKMLLSLYGNNGYGRPIIGFKEEISSLTEEDIRLFYNTYYRPDNAFLFFSGDITEEEIRALAEKYYGSLKNPKEKLPVSKEIGDISKGFRGEIILEDKTVKQPVIMLSILNYNSALNFPLEVLAEIIGEESIGKLYLSFVVDKDLAISTSAYFNNQKHFPGIFNITIYPKDVSDIAEIKKELTKIKEIKITEEDLSKAKFRLISDLIYIKDNLLLESTYLGEKIALGKGFYDYASISKAIEGVTLKEVEEALKFLFSGSASVLGILLPSKEDEEVRND